MTTLTEHTTEFTFSVCHQHKIHGSTISTSYSKNDAGEKVCYECCGERERQSMRQSMRETGKAMLYLTYTQESRRYSFRGFIYPKDAKLVNWPGSFSIPIPAIKIGNHNIARRRFDFWFTFEGEEWHGVQYGDNTQIAHCRRLKKQRG